MAAAQALWKPRQGWVRLSGRAKGSWSGMCVLLTWFALSFYLQLPLAHHPKANVFRRWRAMTALTGGDIGTAAEHFAFAAVVSPFRDVAAQVEDADFCVCAPEAADLL